MICTPGHRSVTSALPESWPGFLPSPLCPLSPASSSLGESNPSVGSPCLGSFPKPHILSDSPYPGRSTFLFFLPFCAHLLEISAPAFVLYSAAGPSKFTNPWAGEMGRDVRCTSMSLPSLGMLGSQVMGALAVLQCLQVIATIVLILSTFYNITSKMSNLIKIHSM